MRTMVGHATEAENVDRINALFFRVISSAHFLRDLIRTFPAFLRLIFSALF